MKKPDRAIPPIPHVKQGNTTMLPQELIRSAQASFEFTCTSVQEAIVWDCSVDFAIASKMSEKLRSPHLTKSATCAGKRRQWEVQEHKKERPSASPSCKCHDECGKGQEQEAAIHTPHQQFSAEEVDKFWCVLYSATRQRTCWLARRTQTIEWETVQRVERHGVTS